MSIRIACPSCKAAVNAPDRVAGKKCCCPRCGGVVIVPHPRGWGPAGSGTSVAGLLKEAEGRGDPGSRRRGLPVWAWVLFAVAGAGLLGGVVATALLRGDG
jgi:hypothetical protein